jgi:hypothetical protein
VPTPVVVPVPTPIVSATLPTEEDKPIDPSQLMFKTMPKGFDIPKNYVKPTVAAPLPPQPVQAVSGAPRPASSSYMVAPQGPAAPSSPNDQVDQAAHGGSSKTLWATLIVVLILLVAAGAVWYFMFYSKAKPSISSTGPSVQSTTTTSANTDNSAVANTANTTTATPPVSQIPADWMQKYFAQYLVNGVCPVTQQSVCGDSADPDTDGLTNLQEYKDSTNPIVADTDGIGIADGDAINIFNLNPNTEHTGGNPKYTDSQDLQDKYNSSKHASFTAADLVQIAANISEFKLHQPTISTLGATLVDFYTNYTSTQNSVSNPAPTPSPTPTPTPQTSQTQPSQ